MDIQEAFRRLWHRMPVVLLIVAVGAAAGYALRASDDTTYTSSARLVLGDPMGASPAASADEAAAIATSPTRVEAAIEAAGVPRDSGEVAELVSVVPLGSSPVLALRVSDVDPEVAADLANALADEVINTRQSLIETPESGTEVGPAVIEQARPTTDPDPSRTAQDTALGALLGLVAGLAAAAALEVLRPTLISPREVAAALGTPHLGEIPVVSNGARHEDGAGIVSPLLATAITRAAHQAKIASLRVVPVDQSIPIEPVIADLKTALAHVHESNGHSSSGNRPDNRLASTRQRLAVERPTAHHEMTPSPGHAPAGVVLIAPTKVVQRTLLPASSAVAHLGEPVLGVVTYRPRKLARAHTTEPHTGDSEQ